MIYRVFNEGYLASSGGDPVREELTAEAIRLDRILRGPVPDIPEVSGLLALMLLNDGRRTTRVVGGEIITRAEQDRDGWDRALIDEGNSLVRWCLAWTIVNMMVDAETDVLLTCGERGGAPLAASYGNAVDGIESLDVPNWTGGQRPHQWVLGCGNDVMLATRFGNRIRAVDVGPHGDGKTRMLGLPGCPPGRWVMGPVEQGHLHRTSPQPDSAAALSRPAILGQVERF